MKKRILILLGILIIGGGAAGVCWKMGVFGQQESSADAVYVTKISDLTGQTAGVSNRYAGVVEPQETVEVELESGRTVKEVQVKTGDEVKKGQLLFEYDLSSIQESLEEAQLGMDQLKNEANSLSEQIATLEKEKKQASKDNQLSYTIEIETNKMNLKKNEYSQKSKQAEIDKLQSATGNTEVRSTIDGVIQKIDTSKLTTDDNSSLDDTDSAADAYSDNSGSSNAFITILSTGAYRIKGTVNEMNVGSIIEGEPVIVRSRVDNSQTWKGSMGTIDKESATSNNSNSYFGMVDSSGDSQTNTSSYPFYVNLDSSDGLMLGQHVYIEMDEGQDEQKQGVWLSEAYIMDIDSDQPYVWAVDKKNKLERRTVILGQYDETLGEYEIADGLTKNDYIAYPSEILEEGMATTTNIENAMDTDTVDMEPTDTSDFDGESIPDELDAEPVSDYEMSDDGTVTEDMDAFDDSIVEDGSEDMPEDDSMDDMTEDFSDSNEILDDDLMPVQEDTQ
ncbi:efflux RND transporter periplasmic adaptor subunit [Blautia sp. MSJ-19]|uniref:efflux RND transporter periplasmic adaptor subunit n=1 Tax=Blautia sp. MSJ-19 TaxID=2841517 RepID=UPI001C0EB2B8|nr:efflux RND transporter periplasmic adaptor subunit [Blautia sp. MSJ-19]MBU5479988.1 biotin/lipoyl-binding protein [Blautia sp. MSJ-19]